MVPPFGFASYCSIQAPSIREDQQQFQRKIGRLSPRFEYLWLVIILRLSHEKYLNLLQTKICEGTKLTRWFHGRTTVLTMKIRTHFLSSTPNRNGGMDYTRRWSSHGTPPTAVIYLLSLYTSHRGSSRCKALTIVAHGIVSGEKRGLDSLSTWCHPSRRGPQLEAMSTSMRSHGHPSNGR